MPPEPTAGSALQPAQQPTLASTEQPSQETAAASTSQPARKNTSIFTLPAPLRTFFAVFPLQTYPSNTLPLRNSVQHDRHLLYIFADPSASSPDQQSPNPSCLRWQAYLRISGIDFASIPSNNHASPSGALPFLLPREEQATKRKAPEPVAAGKIRRWVEQQQEKPQQAGEQGWKSSAEEEVFLALLDHRIRRAWLNQLYLDARNQHIVRRLYVNPCSSNVFVRMTIHHQLRAAATEELRKSNVVPSAVTEEEVVTEAKEALRALEERLGERAWFSSPAEGERPGLLDAAVFSYTSLLLDEGEQMGWVENPLGRELKEMCPALVGHVQRMQRDCGW